MCGAKSKRHCASSVRSHSLRVSFSCLFGSVVPLAILLLLSVLVPLPVYSDPVLRPVQEMTDEELIEELSQLNDALKAENENLKMNNLGLGMQSQILTQSNGEIVSLYTIQGNLLTEALKLSEKFSAEAEAAKKANQIETWFWRIVGLAGAAYGLYQASK